MKLQCLLAIPFVIGIAACSSAPTIEASSRAEAMAICASENENVMRQVKKEQQLIKAKPSLFDRDREDFYDNFEWDFLHSDKFETVTIIKTYCQPRPKQNHKGIWFVTGYIEYLTVPTESDILGGDSEVKKVITSYPTAWKE